ncbi:MAG TPA: hypothetical protein VFY73_24615 [Ideonella sp.]|uniref:hypothetical protein n=1 Tax=Ideonella sp. TaxID=1929293 RepID=UPI002E3320CF|nr:hypothetical protein [Ideonella sp.]HEX5687211.1 hypothetical protein [Ideonella sp.]
MLNFIEWTFCERGAMQALGRGLYRYTEHLHERRVVIRPAGGLTKPPSARKPTVVQPKATWVFFMFFSTDQAFKPADKASSEGPKLQPAYKL